MKTLQDCLVELMDELELDVSTAFSPDSSAQNAKAVESNGPSQQAQIEPVFKAEDLWGKND
jgi:hypothetical protein